MNIARIKKPSIYISIVFFLSMPSLWDIRQQQYSTVKDSHTATLSEEARLKQRKCEVLQDIQDMQRRLDQKHRQVDAISSRLAALQISIKEIEKQM